jgi:CHAD domain-containing protein
VKKTLERELKLEADGLAIDELGGEPLETRTFTSVYHDTDDRLLLRLGISLRRRTENGKSVWQLKLPRDGARLELEAEGGPAEPPAELAGVLRAPLHSRRLEPVASLRTRRSGRLVDGAELTLDSVEVLDGQRVVTSFSEVEAELVTGQPELLDALEERLRQAGARRTDGRSKIRRVLDPPEPEQPGRRAPAVAHLRAMLREQHDKLVGHDPGVRLGGDPEDVHAMRVAVRRSRAVLRAAKPMLDPDWVDELRSELEWLGDSLAPVRDLDVLTAYVERELESLADEEARHGQRLVELLRADHARARGALLEALNSDRYFQLLSALGAAADVPRVSDADVEVVQLARKEFRKLGKRHRRLGDDPSAAALHKFRIRGKRARYAAELAERARGARATRFVDRAKELQDVLGEHQDAIVAEDVLRELARRSRHAGASLAAGRIVERQQARRLEARKALPKTWKRLKRAGDRAWRSG